MARLPQVFTEEALVLVKAWPHVGFKRGETVCCAGVTRNREWRRQFPISFRTLDDSQKFGRWQWISYKAMLPSNDKRPESRALVGVSIEIVGDIKKSERAQFLRPLVRKSTDEAVSKGETLALVEPMKLTFYWEEKTDGEMAIEAALSREWAGQYSFLNDPVAPLEPCKYRFKFAWIDSEGNKRNNTCDDWETGVTYRRREKELGSLGALNSMKEQFEIDYMKKGCVFAMGTHSQHPATWLLVGVIRLDHVAQLQMF
jgi:hypothetical protein